MNYLYEYETIRSKKKGTGTGTFFLSYYEGSDIRDKRKQNCTGIGLTIPDPQHCIKESNKK
jgi:hypothetical protein